MNVFLINHVVTSDKDLFGQIGVIPHGVTDHFIAYFSRNKSKTTLEKESHCGREYEYGNMDKHQFKLEILTHDWDIVYNNTDANET